MSAAVLVGRARYARFAAPDVVLEGWYAVAAASDVARGAVVPVDVGPHRLVVFRAADGRLGALARACGHLGADLAQGRVTEKGVQCAFHAWCWDAEGACVAGGGAAARRRTRAHVAIERWGLVWVWGGAGAPTHALPEPAPENARRVVRLPPQRLAAHPHLVLGNGLDTSHVGPVHRLRFEDPRVRTEPPHRVALDVTARFGATALRRLLGLAGRTATWTFTTVGPSLAWVRVHDPTPFELLWTLRPLPDGRSESRTVFFLPRRRALVRGLPMMVATTWADRRVLEGVRFRPGFVPSDSVFAAYADLVEGMPVWEVTT